MVNENNCQVASHAAKFEASCPSGSMSREKFVELSRQALGEQAGGQALGEQADFLSEALFRKVDQSKFSALLRVFVDNNQLQPRLKSLYCLRNCNTTIT